MQKILLFLGCGVLSGCVAVHAGGMSSKATDTLARVSGDYRVSAGAPVSVYLRSIDGRSLQFWQHAADVEAGSHRLLVDCAVAATKKLTRYELNVTLNAGVKYSLRAEATPQHGCTQVSIEHTK